MTPEIVAADKGTEDANAFLRYCEILAGESDRGAIIVGAALLDDLLRALLIACLAPSPEREDELLDGYSAPCSSFGARIDLAFRIGAIGLSTRSSLHLIRRMRNETAHVAEHRDFSSPQIRERVRELVRRDTGLLEAVRTTCACRAANDPSAQHLVEKLATLDSYIGELGWRATWDIYVPLVALSMQMSARARSLVACGKPETGRIPAASSPGLGAS